MKKYIAILMLFFAISIMTASAAPPGNDVVKKSVNYFGMNITAATDIGQQQKAISNQGVTWKGYFDKQTFTSGIPMAEDVNISTFKDAVIKYDGDNPAEIKANITTVYKDAGIYTDASPVYTKKTNSQKAGDNINEAASDLANK